MPPQGRGRGGGAGGEAGRAGSPASADPGAGPSTSGRSGPASQLSLLPAPLLRAYRALPAAAEALLPAPVTQRPGGGGSAAGRDRGPGSGRLAALREGKEHLSTLDRELNSLPYPSPPQQAAAVAELLSTHPAETAALLRLYSAALRPWGEGSSGGGSGGGGSSGGGGIGGGGGSGGGGVPLEAFALEGWRADTATSVELLLGTCPPLPPSRHALSVLRFALALLRAQTLPALSRRMAAVAHAAANSAGGSRVILPDALTLLGALDAVMSQQDTALRALPAEEASLRAACMEEYARSLAESGLLENAARALLLLQARGQQRSLSTATGKCTYILIHSALAVWKVLGAGGVVPKESAAGAVSPAAAAHLRSVLRGRCLQTAVLVYGVSTLRLLDGGPSYGLPAALHTVGHALRYDGADQALNPTALRLLRYLLASPTDALPPLGADLDALPPAAPAEVAAALAAGLLPALAALPDHLRSGPANPRGPFAELLAACDEAWLDGSGLAHFLAPLLAYGETEQAEGLLGALGRAGGLVGPSVGGGACTGPFREAATSLLGALAGALQRCRRLGPAAAEAPAGPVEAAEGAGADESSEAEAGAKASGGPCGAASRALKPPPAPPVHQLRRLVEYASELWGLPLPAQPAAVGSMGGEAN
ncbi:hypothetical protein HYH03_003818 [Edaphochlamys debaryana]|uniref:Uncharacterized protein n=1 Tax=Edaphochlamys debaryana TaxID=47281 RepID=A0A836C3S0_9CHLO|nr:hypothetical protein HYH03_003818 [Edaphochlamys debaryana]|eukprot:KAG2498057.1 hypothetical protein HYH03_003818 [Edaphochlamys debaryana]